MSNKKETHLQSIERLEASHKEHKRKAENAHAQTEKSHYKLLANKNKKMIQKYRSKQ